MGAFSNGFSNGFNIGGNLMPDTYAGGPKTGAKCKLYRNAGTHESPDWEEIKAVGDASLDDFIRNVAELKRRGNDWVKNLPALLAAFAFNFELVHGLDSNSFTALRTDFLAGTVREYALMSGAIDQDGEQGLSAPMLVEEFPMNQPLEEAIGHSIKLSLAFMVDANGDEIDPTWLEVGSGS